MKKSLLLFILAFAFQISANAIVRNVPATYSTIQLALNACLTGDTVSVQPGVYPEIISWPSTANIKLLAVGDTSNTMITANFSGRVMRFVTALVDTNTLIRGFRISEGYLSGSMAQGAGVFVSGCSPKFDRVYITYNHGDGSSWNYGGGVYLDNSNAVFRNSSISNNVFDGGSWGYGCGVHITNGGAPKFYYCTVKKNFSQVDTYNHGAGIYVTDANGFFDHVTIRGNYGQNSIGYNHGVGLYSKNGNCKLLNSIVDSNSAGNNCNYAYGIGAYFSDGNSTITNTIIRNNKIGNDGGYYYGAGLYFRDCDNVMLTNSLVAGNSFGTGANYYYGTGMYFESATASIAYITNCTVADNFHTTGVFINNGIGMYYNTNVAPIILNSIFWNPSPGLEIAGMPAATVSYSDVEGGYSGLGVIDLDPDFYTAPPYHLHISSPCVNFGNTVGSPTEDLNQNPRPMPAGSSPDLGCYEVDESIIPPDITVAAMTTTDYCKGDSIHVTFNVTGTFNAGNVFFAQLSDSTGNFSFAVNIGSLSGLVAGTTHGVIPITSLSATGYRVRVMSSDPYYLGTENGVDLTVKQHPVVTLSATDTTVCHGTTTTITAGGGTGYAWVPGSFATAVITPIIMSSVTYTVTVTGANSCKSTGTIAITHLTMPTVDFPPLDPDTVCKTATSILLSGGTPSGGIYTGTGVTGGAFEPSAVAPGTYVITYTYTDPNSCFASNPSSITVIDCATIGTEELLTEKSWKVRQDGPDALVVSLEWDQQEPVQVTLINLLGQQLFDKTISLQPGSNEIRLRHYSNSENMYFIRLKSAGSSESKKIFLR